jgi:putative oxidoreductase
MKVLQKYADYAYFLMRVVAGLMFAFHGTQKLFGIFSAVQPPVGSQLWIGGVIELTCGLAVVLGFQTRLAAFLCSGMMLVAYAQFHWKFQFGPEFFPAINKGELAALYCVAFFLIACRGGIKWCLDQTD